MDSWVTISLVFLALVMAGVALYFGLKKNDQSSTLTAATEQRYNCDTTNGMCVPSESGSFSNLDDCTNNCEQTPPKKRYSCANNRCYTDPNGVYTSLSDCNAACPNLQFVYPMPVGHPWRYRRGPWRHMRRRWRRHHGK